MSSKVKPFSFEYVLRTTIKHMKACVDTSLKKTYDRIKDFEGDSEKAAEILKTLSALNSINRMLDEIIGEEKEKQNG